MDVTVSLRSPAFRYFAAATRSPDTCRHSSRVGTTTSARGMPVSSRVGVGGDALQQGYAEGEGLAHAGAGLTDQVVAGQRQRQSQFLDGEGMFDAILGQCAHYFVANSEFGKCWVQCGHAG